MSNDAAHVQPGSIEVAPAYLEVTLSQPDEVYKIEVSYTNHSQSRVELALFPIDFKQQENGAIGFLTDSASTYSYSLASFLSFTTTNLTLAPQEKRTISVQVKNRNDLSPGGHYAAVVATLVNPHQTSTSATIAPSVSSLILVRKTGGERFHLSLHEVDWPQQTVVFSYPWTISLLFQNEGNIHLIPYGRVEIRDMYDRLLYQGIINTSSTFVFPETRKTLTVPLQPIERSWPVSINTFTIRGEDSLKKVLYRYDESFIYIHPLVLFVVIAVALWLLRRLYLKRKKKKT